MTIEALTNSELLNQFELALANEDINHALELREEIFMRMEDK